MENQLEIIKANLPFGYEKKIAAEVGCSQGTVHNIFNPKRKNTDRSTFKVRVLEVAKRMIDEKLTIMERINTTASKIENSHEQPINQA